MSPEHTAESRAPAYRLNHVTRRRPMALRPSLPPCAAPEYRAFDFWVGSWEVYQPDGTRAGRRELAPVYARALGAERVRLDLGL